MAASWQALSIPGGRHWQLLQHQPEGTTSLEEEQDTAFYWHWFPEGNYLQMFKSLIVLTSESTNKPQGYPQRRQHPISKGMSSSKEEESSCLIFPMGAGQRYLRNSKLFSLFDYSCLNDLFHLNKYIYCRSFIYTHTHMRMRTHTRKQTVSESQISLR